MYINDKNSDRIGNIDFIIKKWGRDHSLFRTNT